MPVLDRGQMTAGTAGTPHDTPVAVRGQHTGVRTTTSSSRRAPSAAVRWIAALLALVTAISLTACKPALNADRKQGSFTVGMITPEGIDRFVFEDRSTGLTVRAPASNTGGNLRAAVVKTNAPVLVDQQSCVNWNGPIGGMVQPGVVLRAKVEPDRTRAVMVTNNIFFGYHPGFNVHLADTNGLNETGTGPGTNSYALLAQFDLSAGVGGFQDRKPLPWRICARVTGRQLTLKVWSVPSFVGEPSWSDPTYAKRATLPQRSVYAGQPGMYVGHVRAREHTHFNRLAAGSIPTAPPTTTPPTTTPSTTTTAAPPATVPLPTTTVPAADPAVAASRASTTAVIDTTATAGPSPQ